ncbi:MAG TPA: class I SAM-dependent methyltransferase [Pseudomonadales bacterium]
METLRTHVLFEVHRDLPRAGPGHDGSTRRALARVLAAPAAAPPRVVLDVGCGPGMQTRELARALPEACILAADLYEPFLRRLAESRAAGDGPAARVLPIRADMGRLPVAGASVDLVWCEGAAYILGVERSLAVWRQLLRPDGACAFTEAVWLRPEPPDELRRFWEVYPAMGDVPHTRELVRRAGFELLEDFVLPRTAWWEHYYEPMSERVALLERRYRDDPAALEALAGCRREIDVYRRFGDWYGYAFFVARRTRGA